MEELIFIKRVFPCCSVHTGIDFFQVNSEVSKVAHARTSAVTCESSQTCAVCVCLAAVSTRGKDELWSSV